MIIPPCRIECPVGSTLQVPVTIFDAEDRAFDDCRLAPKIPQRQRLTCTFSKLQLRSKVETPGVFVVDSAPLFMDSLSRSDGDRYCKLLERYSHIEFPDHVRPSASRLRRLDRRRSSCDGALLRPWLWSMPIDHFASCRHCQVPASRTVPPM